MTSISDYVRVLHDIDAAKGRVCGACMYSRGYGRCVLRHLPYDLNDGCGDWLADPVKLMGAPFHGRGGSSA